MNNAAPETPAALQSRIAELEQQLKLSDQGVSRLAERCLALEKEVQSYLAVHPQREMRTDSPALLHPLLYYDAGFGFSEKDTLSSPDCVTDGLIFPAGSTGGRAAVPRRAQQRAAAAKEQGWQKAAHPGAGAGSGRAAADHCGLAAEPGPAAADQRRAESQVPGL